MIGQDDFGVIDFGTLQGTKTTHFIHWQLGKQAQKPLDIGIFGIPPELPKIKR